MCPVLLFSWNFIEKNLTIFFPLNFSIFLNDIGYSCFHLATRDNLEISMILHLNFII